MGSQSVRCFNNDDNSLIPAIKELQNLLFFFQDITIQFSNKPANFRTATRHLRLYFKIMLFDINKIMKSNILIKLFICIQFQNKCGFIQTSITCE